MARHGSAPVESRNPSSSSTGKPTTNLTKPLPVKPTGIIILPPSYRHQDDDDSPPSSNSDSQLDPSASLPDLGAERLHRTQTPSSTSLNVKFAPLPQIAPRKRRSTAPLGIASRGAMMRRRRAGMPGYDMNGDPLPPTPMWTDEEVQRHTQAIIAERSGQTPPRDIDDPFMTLGRIMKGAGKQFWRKVNKKPGEVDEKGSGEENLRPGSVVFAERQVLAPISGSNGQEEEGGVWEEAVDDRFLNVSQTETIVEGQYSWPAPQLKPSLEDTGSVSDDASGREHNLSSAEGTEEGTEEGSTVESHTS
ncbi:hypothetical protein C8F04DRAFT_42124 [Mycena alexandri]|uniref:Uncharacterized protein n=1 Tax=Mycena alexandri TaxID=1745969 RepID=A0AAD6WVW7_9AGAR|nr:hypothetical protein C8F04DRAFT_42124 [Mycena alexandri]